MRTKKEGLVDKLPSLSSVTICVNQDVLSVSEMRNSGKCIVAQAVRALGAEYTSVNVTSDTIAFNYRGWRYAFPTPANVAIKVIEFDDEKKVEPFTFRVSRPYTRPSLKRPCSKGRGPTKNPTEFVEQRERRNICGPKRCVRRYHGIKMIVVNEG